MATNLAYAYAADITKVETDANGDLLVYGRAAGPDLDADQQICDPEWLKKAMPSWAEWGNVREMHQPICAGVGLVTEETDDGWSVKSKVVDDNTAKKIHAKALKGYSVGIKDPRVVKDATAPGGRIVGGEIVEISYVDRPANPTAKLMICKAVGASPALAPVEAPVAKSPTPLDLASDLQKLLNKHSDATPKPVADEPLAPPEPVGAVLVDPVIPAPEVAKAAAGAAAPADDQPGPATAGEGTVEKAAGTLSADDALTKAIVEALQSYADRVDAAKGAMPPLKPGGPPRYPINSVQDLKDAIQAFGRGKDTDKAKIKAHIKAEAKRLGKSDLIPDDWKALLVKDAAALDNATTKHDPAELKAILAGLVNCMKAELDELVAGENEIWDIRRLLETVSGFCSWWSSEAYGGETTSPYNESGPTYMSLSADPDQTKTADATAATGDVAPAADADATKTADATKAADVGDTAKTDAPNATKAAAPAAGEKTGTTSGGGATSPADENGLAALVKSAIADAITPSVERIATLEATLAKALALPESGGPVITRTSGQAAAAGRHDSAQVQAQINELMSKAAATTDMTLRRGYTDRANVLKKALV
jgi:hypothetical protein